MKELYGSPSIDVINNKSGKQLLLIEFPFVFPKNLSKSARVHTGFTNFSASHIPH